MTCCTDWCCDGDQTCCSSDINFVSRPCGLSLEQI
jgi:hypothetical protein